MKWLEVAVRVPPQGVELVADIFGEAGAGGVIIEDEEVVRRRQRETPPEEWGVPEGSIRLGLPAVIGYLPVTDGAGNPLEELRSKVEDLGLQPAPQITARVVDEEDWSECWRAYYRPVRVSPRLIVVPAWENYRPREGEAVVRLDPGMAFGNGTHATTLMCLRLLEEYLRPGQLVYDIGTGSGVLAIAAALLGAGRVVAVDVDPVAVRVARGNVAKNGLVDRVEIVEGSLLGPVSDKAGLIVANIIAGVIMDMAPDAARFLLPGGGFIACGIIAGRAGEVEEALARSGFNILKRAEEDGWAAFYAEKA